MPDYAIHRSRKHPNKYLVTKNRNDFSVVPPEAMESLGELDFVKETSDLNEDSDTLGASVDTIVDQITNRGYYMQPGKETDMP